MDIISIIFIVAIIIGINYTRAKFPSFRDLWMYHMSVSYRFLFELHSLYKHKESYGWDFDNTYLEQAKSWLNGHLGKQGQNYELAEMIYTRLGREEFVQYYFSASIFRYDLEFLPMWKDMRNGDWQKRSYGDDIILKNNLPIEIASNSNAFADFKKFVIEKWFDPITGKPNIKNDNPDDADNSNETQRRKKYEIGRAIYWICKRNNIPNAARVFATCWQEAEATIHDWTRNNRNELIAEQLNKMIFKILDK